MEGSVGTVVISTEEYISDKFEIFNLKEEVKNKECDLKAAIKCYQMAADAIRAFVRAESHYGEYKYLSDNLKALLESIGEDWRNFDLTVRPTDLEEIVYEC